MSLEATQLPHDVRVSTAAPSARPGGALGGRVAVALFFLIFGIYSLTGSKLRFGYEGLNIEQSEAIVRGTTMTRPDGGILPFSQGGLIDVVCYLPATVAKFFLEKHGLLLGLRQLIYVFVIPFFTALTVLIFYQLALELYRRVSTALALTLILALATQMWPYSKFGMETQQTLWNLAAIYALVRYARGPSARWAGTFGASCGLLMLTKMTGLIHVSALCAAWAWLAWRGGLWRRKMDFASETAWAFVFGAIGFALFLFSNRWRYGGWIWGGRYHLDVEAYPMPLIDGLWAILFSWGKSVFIFAPPLLVTLWYWARFWRRFPVMRAIAAVMILLAIYHLDKRTWADETWGDRRHHYIIPLLVLPLGMWLEDLGALRLWVRWLGWATIWLGLAVQILGILFDYTAMAKIAGFTETFAQDNTLWQPQFCHPRFNLHLLESRLHRARTGDSLPFIYERYYIPCTAPAVQPPAIVFPQDGYDNFDFWVLQQRADWPGKPFWFRTNASHLFFVFVFMVLASGGWLWLKRREMGRDAIPI
jgi:hypothetical protein